MPDIRYCSVCRKSQHEVVRLDVGSDGYFCICDECIEKSRWEWIVERSIAFQTLGTDLLIDRTVVGVLLVHLLLTLLIHLHSIVNLPSPLWSLCYCISTLAVALVLSMVIHEVGHAIAAVLTGSGVHALYVGIFNGLCWRRVKAASLFKDFLTRLAGPLANLMVVVVMTGGIVSGYTQPDGPLRLLYFLLIITNAYSFIHSLIPDQEGTSDGARLLRILKPTEHSEAN